MWAYVGGNGSTRVGRFVYGIWSRPEAEDEALLPLGRPLGDRAEESSLVAGQCLENGHLRMFRPCQIYMFN